VLSIKRTRKEIRLQNSRILKRRGMERKKNETKPIRKGANPRLRGFCCLVGENSEKKTVIPAFTKGSDGRGAATS